jgi:hypothetical protein
MLYMLLDSHSEEKQLYFTRIASFWLSQLNKSFFFGYPPGKFVNYRKLNYIKVSSMFKSYMKVITGNSECFGLEQKWLGLNVTFRPSCNSFINFKGLTSPSIWKYQCIQFGWIWLMDCIFHDQLFKRGFLSICHSVDCSVRNCFTICQFLQLFVTDDKAFISFGMFY